MLLAQSTQPTGAAPSAGDSFFRFFLPLLLAMGIFYFFLFRGQRRERQKHASLLANLKRNDRVQTIGGMYGTVVDVRDQEVVLKVDESANVKIRFNRAAIKEVLTSAEEAKS